ncbi:hypothetical protein GQ54DRAFT_300682 [Martensiomyces pterosporus]|nr:hypothetical protein GQ54DRAFT_300682 [Martensiomyces pterosporus]
MTGALSNILSLYPVCACLFWLLVITDARLPASYAIARHSLGSLLAWESNVLASWHTKR